MLLSEYETTLVLRADLPGDDVEATLDRVRDAVSASGGQLLGIDHWGRKRLAFPMRKQTRGLFVCAQYLGQGGLVAEVERNLRISENVIRFMTTRTAVKVDPQSRTVRPYEIPKYDQLEESHDVPGMRPDDDRYDRGGRDDDRGDRYDRGGRDDDRGDRYGRGGRDENQGSDDDV